MNRINKATLLLGAISITDVYINSHTFPQDKNEYFAAKQKVTDKLCEKGRPFKSGYFDEKEYEDFAISASSYSKMTCRDIFLHVKLEDKYVKDNITDIQTAKLEKCKFEDTYLVFLHSANAVVLTSVVLDDFDLSYDEYQQLCRALHTCFPLLYKDLVVELCTDYYRVMKTYYADTTKVTLKEESLQDASFETHIKCQTLNFSIYNHFIFDSELHSNDSDIHTFFANEECMEKMTESSVNKTKIKYGYTHSFYLFGDSTKRNYYEKLYKLPLFNVLANWATIRAITNEIGDLSDACKNSLKGKFIISSHNKMKKYLLKIEELYAEFDGYSITNNPINYHLIHLYKKAFGEYEHMDRLTKKREQVYSFMATLSNQRIEHSTNFTNAILTIIACVAVFEVIELNILNVTILSVGLLIVYMIRRFIQNKKIKL